MNSGRAQRAGPGRVRAALNALTFILPITELQDWRKIAFFPKMYSRDPNKST